MTRVYLAWGPSGSIKITFDDWDWEARPASLLVSYVYERQYKARAAAHGFKPVRTILDSGAYSAWNSGKVINRDALTAETKSGRWDEAVTLDVVGDHEASRENALWMQAQGSPAYPVFHFGEPWELFEFYCDNFWKVGISCRFGEPVNESRRWVEQCFARRWPHRYHSFGWVDKRMLRSVPFHSADTATWFAMPDVHGRWRAFGGGKLSVRGQKDMRAEAEHFLDEEEELRWIWRKEMALLETLPGPPT